MYEIIDYINKTIGSWAYYPWIILDFSDGKEYYDTMIIGIRCRITFDQAISLKKWYPDLLDDPYLFLTLSKKHEPINK